MRGVISAPRNIITGAFNIRFAFQKDVELTRDDVIVMPIEGDALGHVKDTFGESRLMAVRCAKDMVAGSECMPRVAIDTER